ncbi:MAG TPA: sigma-54 dependent transcriptional regulator [Mariprofundaceae bacterium]|nr:sigma-54 dependent transcriptional regulator [Mariprofundaceae bacterium]
MLILIIEDERRIREGIAQMLTEDGYDVLQAETMEQGIALVESEFPAVVLSDINLPDGDGFTALRYCLNKGIETSFIFMTAFGSRDVAIQAIQEGAYDYVSKPLRFDELFARLKRLEEMQNLKGQVNRKSERKLAESRLAILGDSPPMQRVKVLAGKAAESDAPLLITGETGVGKGLLAKLVHATSHRSKQPFISINCASIPENLLESELFGYHKGAFTGADKNKKGLFDEVGEGTLFMDEIGEMSIPLQAKLLHVLDDGTFRPLGSTRDLHFRGRMIAATNVALEDMIVSRDFRQDLFYRLSVLTIEVPPLRSRHDDLLPLAESIYRELSSEMGRPFDRLPLEVAQEVQNQAWPGNVRELRNYLERTLIFGETPMEDAGDEVTLADAVHRFERSWIERVILECGGDKAAAAERLGVGLSTLYRKQES